MGIGPKETMTPLVFICLGLSTPNYSLQPTAAGFVVKKDGKGETVFMRSNEFATLSSVMFTRHGRYAVWDRRGLTVRAGKYVISTHFEAVPTSPKFFSREEIRANLDDFKSGKLHRPASALSGSVLRGDTAYFLVRWTKADGSTWFEALAQVDLGAKKPEAVIVERQVGTSFATEAIEDRLISLGDRLGVVARTESDWGIATFKPASQAASFVPLGQNLHGYRPLNGTAIAFAEISPSGTKRVGRVDLVTKKRVELLESRDFDHLVPGEGPMIADLAVGGRHFLRTLGSGAELPLDPDTGVWRCSYGVIVGLPLAKPRRASLYDPATWRVLASWSLKRPTATLLPLPRSAAF